MAKPVVKPRRGRPANTQLDYVRAAWWARSVQLAARKTLGALEREIDPHAVYPRDIGGYTQDGKWKGYATGKSTPTPVSAGEKSPVVRAEKLYPGTQAIFESVIWDVIARPKPRIDEVRVWLTKISPAVRSQLTRGDFENRDLWLSPRGMAKVSRIRHLDALALLLLQWRGERRYLKEFDLHCLREWLMHSSRWIFQFRMNRVNLLNLLSNEVPEISLLALPENLTFDMREEDIDRLLRATLILAGVPAMMAIQGESGRSIITFVVR